MRRKRRRYRLNPSRPRQPIVCGADVELGNFILGAVDSDRGARADEVAQAVLREIPGVPHRRPTFTPRPNSPGWAVARRAQNEDPQDVGRRFLTAGGCAYIDLSHVEIALPETRSAWDALCAWHAALRLAERAVRAANAKRPAHAPILLVANNTDGVNSWGAHLNFLLRRPTFDDLVYRKLHYTQFLAAFQASAVVIAGQGSVVSPDPSGASKGAFVLGQRARFVHRTTGTQTTFDRPLVNLRDEALADDRTQARLHVIAFDSVLADVARILTVGGMQLVLAMIDAGMVDTQRMLEDPVHAQLLWNSDPTLRARARTIDRRRLTAVEMQLHFLERARRFAARGGFEGMVPRANEILDLWAETLHQLEQRAFDRLASRLDWVLKLKILQRAMELDPSLTWGSPEIAMLDVAYANVDREEGLFWAYQQAGAVERMVSDAEIERLVAGPPDDTRAWTRGMLLRRAPAAVDSVDWHRITFRLRGGRRTLELSDPLSFTRAHTEPLLIRHRELGDLLDALGAGPLESDSLPVTRSVIGAVPWNGVNSRGWCH